MCVFRHVCMHAWKHRGSSNSIEHVHCKMSNFNFLLIITRLECYPIYHTVQRYIPLNSLKLHYTNVILNNWAADG